jgi:hypothetical protein
VGEDVDAAQHPAARVDRKFYFLGSHFLPIPTQKDYWVIIRGSRFSLAPWDNDEIWKRWAGSSCTTAKIRADAKGESV